MFARLTFGIDWGLSPDGLEPSIVALPMEARVKPVLV
jgi:hypothetical protein